MKIRSLMGGNQTIKTSYFKLTNFKAIHWLLSLHSDALHSLANVYICIYVIVNVIQHAQITT